MDIFTTALTKVVPVPIKPERLRIKALEKEPSTNELTDDIDHLEEHEQYIVKEKKKEHDGNNEQNQDDSESENSTKVKKVCSADVTDSAITDRQELLNANNDEEKRKQEAKVKHLDLYI